jgi:hypothetical protein
LDGRGAKPALRAGGTKFAPNLVQNASHRDETSYLEMLQKQVI